jgi:hypothetical protein
MKIQDFDPSNGHNFLYPRPVEKIQAVFWLLLPDYEEFQLEDWNFGVV